MAKQEILNVQLSEDVVARVLAQTGLEISELSYPDPGGELAREWVGFGDAEIMLYALSQALVRVCDQQLEAIEAWMDEELGRLSDLDGLVLEGAGEGAPISGT